jgi:4-hydroxy-3-polyprenylbenzoate decarboxylase
MTDLLKTADRPKASVVVGISGASGVIYGIRTLDACRELGVESHLVVSKSAALTLSRRPISRSPSSTNGRMLSIG